VLDIIPDDANAIFKKKKNVLKWDQRKRNFVQVTGKDITKKVYKNESGKVIKEKKTELEEHMIIGKKLQR